MPQAEDRNCLYGAVHWVQGEATGEGKADTQPRKRTLLPQSAMLTETVMTSSVSDWSLRSPDM